MQIGGLASGIDTVGLVDQLISLERKPILLMNSRINTLQKQKDAWRDINTRLSNLQTKMKELQKVDVFQAQKTTSSNESILTASSTGGTLSGSYNVEVVKLATTTSVSSGTALSKAIDPEATLNSAGFALTPTSGTFSINGFEITVDATTETLEDILAKINVPESGVTAIYDAANDKIQVTSASGIQLGSGADTSNFLQATRILAQADGTTTSVESSSKLGGTKLSGTIENSRLYHTFTANTGTLTINGVEIGYDVTADSLRDIINRVNESKANVVLSYDGINDQLTLTSKETGSKTIALQDSGELLAALGLSVSQKLGSNAQYKINDGNVMTSTSNSITGIAEGLKLELKTLGTATVTLKQDVDSTFEKIKSVIDQYNSVNDFINTKMAKGAELQGDGSLMRVQSNLRMKMSGMVQGLSTDLRQLTSIGIESDRFGKLSIDETKLKEAIKDKSGSVHELFNSSDGIITRLGSYVDSLTKSGEGLISEKQKTFESRIKDINKSIERLEGRLETRRKTLTRQFSAMEQTMSRFMNQGAWLEGQIGQMAGWGNNTK